MRIGEIESRPLPGVIRDLMRACRLVLEGHKEESLSIAQTFFDKHFDPEGLYFTARVLARVGRTRRLPRPARSHHREGLLLLGDHAAGPVAGSGSRPIAIQRRRPARRRPFARGRGRVPPAEWRSHSRPECLIAGFSAALRNISQSSGYAAIDNAADFQVISGTHDRGAALCSSRLTTPHGTPNLCRLHSSSG